MSYSKHFRHNYTRLRELFQKGVGVAENFVFNPDNKRTMLSIDGGGMRGIIPLTMLIYLEQKLNRPAYEIFDMVSGTSTGAIIAAGLGLGYSAQEILDIVYRDRLPKAFGDRNLWFWLRYIFVHRFRYLYPMEPFIDALSPLVGGRKVRDLTSTIVLMTTKDLRTNNTYYIVNAGPGAGTFSDYPVTGAVAASGAAPAFFPPVLGNLVDGGVGVYGNPALAASIEAVEYIGFDPANTLHVSLGTGYASVDQPEGEGSRFGLYRWLQYSVLTGIIEAALQQSYAVRAIYEPRGMDFRRHNVNLTNGVVTGILGLDPGKIDPSVLSLDSNDPSEIALMERIGFAYADLIDWSKPNQMPWDTLAGQRKPGIAPVDWTGSIYV
jgi:hypothetical protein